MVDSKGFGMDRTTAENARGSESDVVRLAVRAVREGHREAFGSLVNRYRKRIFGLSLIIVRDPSGAEEVTQDAFVSAYIHMDRYDMDRPFYPWLVAIAVRHAQTWLRRRLRVTGREGAAPDPGPDIAATESDPLQALIADERGRDLWRLVMELPRGQRTAVILYYMQELKVETIARAMGITGGTVKTLLFRARRSLRQKLDSDTHTLLTGLGKEAL